MCVCVCVLRNVLTTQSGIRKNSAGFELSTLRGPGKRNPLIEVDADRREMKFNTIAIYTAGISESLEFGLIKIGQLSFGENAILVNRRVINSRTVVRSFECS